MKQIVNKEVAKVPTRISKIWAGTETLLIWAGMRVTLIRKGLKGIAGCDGHSDTAAQTQELSQTLIHMHVKADMCASQTQARMPTRSLALTNALTNSHAHSHIFIHIHSLALTHSFTCTRFLTHIDARAHTHPDAPPPPNHTLSCT